MSLESEEITGKIIKAYYEVYNCLGFGFLEKVYANALALEFKRIGLSFGREFPIGVLYKGNGVGDYFADFLVEGEVVVEIKAKNCLNGKDEAQLLNYLKGTGKRVGLLFNFGEEDPKFRRLVFG